MTTSERQQLANKLGLPADLTVVSSASVIPPVDPQAAGGMKELALSAALFASATLLRTTVLESLGLQLRYSATEQAYQLAAPLNQPMTLTADPDSAEVVSESAQLVRFRLTAKKEVLFRLNDIEALAIRVEAGDARAPSVLHTEVLSPALVPPRVWAPLSEWADEVSADEWLSDRLHERAAQGDAWHTAVGIGELLRHSRSAVTLVAPNAPLVRTPLPAGLEKVVAELSARQLEYIVDLGASSVRMIIDSVEELDDLGSDDTDEEEEEEPGFRPQDIDWQVRYAEVCAWREELAAVDALLDARAVVPFYREELQTLDASAFHFVRGFLSSWPNDEGLHRAAYIDPFAWWVIPLDAVPDDA